MISLAPFRYARVLSKYDGPIEKIEYSRVSVGERELYQANAWLSRRLNLQKPGLEVFGEADGTGTHDSAMVARHMAVSEAIERWALYYLKQSGMQRLYGFHLDGTSNGMSAYPGLLSGQARTRARMEAVERYCLVGWWAGKLGADPFEISGGDIRALEIDNPISRHRVVLVWRKDAQGFYVYGFSAGKSLPIAVRKAQLEMERSQAALARFHLRNPGFEEDDLETLANSMERRVVYFSLPEGHRHFRERLSWKQDPAPPCAIEPLVDSRVAGPWNKYATVWRILYPMPDKDYLNAHANCFFW